MVFGAASFIKPGFMPNYVSLAVDYLRRPRCDVLEMIAQNKGVVGFNLIWCAVLPRHATENGFVNRKRVLNRGCRMWDKMELMRQMLDDMFQRVRRVFCACCAACCAT